MSDQDRAGRDAQRNGDRSAELLDADDEGVLRRLGELFDGADGPPEGFTERMRFAVAARGLADELAQLTEPAAVAARGQDRPARTWTFEAASLTILVTAEPTRDGRTRVDGWLAPAGGPHRPAAGSRWRRTRDDDRRARSIRLSRRTARTGAGRGGRDRRRGGCGDTDLRAVSPER